MNLRQQARGVSSILLALTAGGSATSSSLLAQELLQRARHRHQQPDTTLHDYRAHLETLVSAGLIQDPLAPPRLLLASELAASVAWARDAGQQIRIRGQRYVTSFGRNVEAALDFGRPWYVATAPGDSLRLLGSDIELPARAALHPFAAGAERFYRYEIGDTIVLRLGPRTLQLVEIRVTPTRGDAALVVGSLWIDSASGALTGMQIRFVGRPLWADEDEPEGSGLANRILSVSARLEQGLWENRYWLPRRQEVELRVRVPFTRSLTFPVVFRTEFGRYRINTGEPIDWVAPGTPRETADSLGRGMRITVGTGGAGTDSLRVITGPSDGGFEIIRPPDDSLAAYRGWRGPIAAGPEALFTLPSTEELERRAQRLAPEILGRRALAFEYDRLTDLLRYNRVEALGLGVSARWEIPRLPFWSLGGRIGIGVADLEPKGHFGLRYEPPRSRLDLSGYSELQTAGSSPLDPGTAVTSPLRPLLTGRDDADYYRASGVAIQLGRRWGHVRARVAGALEDHRSVERHTGVGFPDIWEDSIFPLNPPADEGTYWRADLVADLFVGEWERPGVRAQLGLGAELGSGVGQDYVQPRQQARLHLEAEGWPRVRVTQRAGWTAGDVPVQREWRIGGLRTVRGYPHGIQQGQAFQSARIEVTLQKGLLEPVLFADNAWAGPVGDWPGDLDDQTASAGVGLGVFWGFLRLDLVFPESGGPWIETYVGGGR